ncbi:dipeptide/oligopeptide/nickel ABC transporter permease/ATP-binding protein [Streptomyces melanosporofaciens]|uniref:Peptide/nickel transport system permease protein n=1 Tax=Streptomyces melanosporofaciens TaxID=67327 RepID=A0A1H4KID5_STRMJ|nr:dipeptide/oligopeptide/nickel ABC transporter permease/ATP-binding protein [Streptomyces melanosporofaciens]SEB58314.1 peptide/nickel transport system permease protein [Streptomyces melanosporofaciens]
MTGIEQTTVDPTPGDTGLRDEPAEQPSVTQRQPRRGSALRALVRRPLAVLSLLWLVAVGVMSVGADALAPYRPTNTDLTHVLAGPNGQHWLGTDQLGRDILSRVLFGGQGVLLGIVEVTLVFVVTGTVMGVPAGYFGRWVDWAVLRWIEITVALPAILILLLVLAVFPGNQHLAMVALGVLGGSGLARVIRAETQRVRTEQYVAAARVSGLRDGQILLRHVVPRLATTILVQASLMAAAAVGVQAGLSFLGLGVQEPEPSWGGLITQASQVLDRSSWMLVPPGGVIGLTMLSLALLGDAVRDVMVQRWSVAPARHGGTGNGEPPVRDEGEGESTEFGGATGQAAPSPLLAVRGLTVAFRTGGARTAVVQGVGFHVDRSEILGIVGESGCGKSVTVSAVLGLLPSSAEVRALSCRFDGAELLSLPDRDRHALRGTRIGYVSQEPMTALDPTCRVGDLLAEAVRRHHGLDRRAARARAVELLDLVNIPDPGAVSRRYPHQISGGMAQRVAIALALAGDPDLLVADEPTTALDARVQAEILALLRRLQAERGLAIVLITHDWGVAAQLCARAVVMYAGQVVEQGPVGTLYHSPAHPYTAGLLAANPHRALDRTSADSGTTKHLTRLPTIPGTVPPPAAWPTSCHFQDRCPLAAADCTRRPIPLAAVTSDHYSRCIHIDRVRELDTEDAS